MPDVLKRTAYTAAYDRRLRHPAWVSLDSLKALLNELRLTPLIAIHVSCQIDCGTSHCRELGEGTRCLDTCCTI